MRKIKSIVIYFFVLIIIILSFKIPEILIELENTNIKIAVYEKEKKKNAIDIETEKIYLVKAIHDIEDGNSLIKIMSSSLEEDLVLIESAEENLVSVESENINNNENINKELLKLEEYDILKNLEINENSKTDIRAINKTYQKDRTIYIMNSLIFKLDNKEFIMEIESKTGKILYISMEKEDLYSESSREDLLKNYVKYLDLYIIDDWKYENDMLKSEKAGLIVNLAETDNNYILSIHSSEQILNSFEYIKVR